MNIALYNVIDIRKDVLILKNVESATVSEITGLGRNAVTTYANTGKPYKNKFIICRANYPGSVPLSFSEADKATMEKFDNGMKALKQNCSPERLRKMKFTCTVDRV